jgi:phospholipid/cholesterol/gamma-HCH transport system permease protein
LPNNRRETIEQNGRKEPGALTFSVSPGGTCLVGLTGIWKTGVPLPSLEEVEKRLTSSVFPKRVAFDTGSLADWDSSFLTFLLGVRDICTREKIEFEMDGLPEGARRLLKLALAVPERAGAKKESIKEPVLSRIGSGTLQFGSSLGEVMGFLGEAGICVVRLLTGKATIRWSDLLLFMQESGSQALPIVSLISLLVGLILAFVGAIQLQAFGAQIYVADLVGIAMVRVMGAIMTGIIMAGRTGAAFAAQLGTMQVNEEIDALKTLGVTPMEFLVLPRMMALTIMMPLLCIYADIMGILGGMIVGVTMLDLNPIVYLNQTKAALSLTNVWIGLFHGTVFGVLVALSGCLRGIQCERSASAVGYAATSAVVTGIVSIIVATAIITIMCNVLGF